MDEERQPEDFDVVLPHAPTDDGAGTRVLRARPGRLEAGEVRLAREGAPVVAGELVRLERRADAPMLYDVKVDYDAKEAQTDAKASARKGPAQVSTHAYRDSWDRTFRRRRADDAAN
jgi:hypothetical protein